MQDTVIRIDNLKKQYRLGTIGGGTLSADLQTWWAKKRGKEDPNSKIGSKIQTGNFWALDGIDLEIKQGEAVGIIGANGAGKSTLLKILSRVTAPTEGTVYVKGRISSMLEVGTGFHPELTGRENIYLNGAILGMSKSEVDAKMDSIIEFSECGQFIDTPVKRYSSGMYVKLAFSVAANLDSEILVMDEVLAVGDMKFQQKCLGKMSDASHGEGKTVLYVSHNMATIKQLCSRCIVLSHGQVIFDGDVDRAIEIYMGEENKNLLSFYDLSQCVRSEYQPGEKIHLESIEFIDKDKPDYLPKEKVRMKIRWSATELLRNIHLYFILRYVDSSVVGMAESEVLGDAIPGEIGEAIVSFDISNIADGTYCFVPDIYILDEDYHHQSFDHPLQKIYFKITSEESRKGIFWQRQYYGNISLNPLIVEKG